MAKDFTIRLREAIVTHLSNDTAMTAKVPAARIFGMRTPREPEWPFTRYGTPQITPRRAQCLDGSDNDITLHVFSKSADEQECSEILAAMAASLDGAEGKGIVLQLEGGGKAHILWRGSQIIPDAAEANAWHGLARFEATITS